jgi:HEPN domain-containing protein
MATTNNFYSANLDIMAVQALCRAGLDDNKEMVLFHLQQAAEKLSLEVWGDAGMPPLQNHNFGQLIDCLVAVGKFEWSEEERDAAYLLGKYATWSRYTYEGAWSSDDAMDAVRAYGSLMGAFERNGYKTIDL